MLSKKRPFYISVILVYGCITLSALTGLGVLALYAALGMSILGIPLGLFVSAATSLITLEPLTGAKIKWRL